MDSESLGGMNHAWLCEALHVKLAFGGLTSEDGESGLRVGSKQGREQFVLRRRKRVRDRDSLPRKPLLQVFR